MATKLREFLKPKEPTKKELYAEARILGIKGRSKMNKPVLKAAVRRRQSKLTEPHIWWFTVRRN